MPSCIHAAHTLSLPTLARCLLLLRLLQRVAVMWGSGTGSRLGNSSMLMSCVDVAILLAPDVPCVVQVIREATIKWAMIDQLQNPPAAFADVIKAHFRLRAPYILKQVSTWIDEAPASGHKTRLQELHIQLRTELDRLN